MHASGDMAKRLTMRANKSGTTSDKDAQLLICRKVAHRGEGLFARVVLEALDVEIVPDAGGVGKVQRLQLREVKERLEGRIANLVVKYCSCRQLQIQMQGAK